MVRTTLHLVRTVGTTYPCCNTLPTQGTTTMLLTLLLLALALAPACLAYAYHVAWQPLAAYRYMRAAAAKVPYCRAVPHGAAYAPGLPVAAPPLTPRAWWGLAQSDLPAPGRYHLRLPGVR